MAEQRIPDVDAIVIRSTCERLAGLIGCEVVRVNEERPDLHLHDVGMIKLAHQWARVLEVVIERAGGTLEIPRDVYHDDNRLAHVTITDQGLDGPVLFTKEAGPT